jgi:GNAT superfamily N-acetyltransferase
MVENVKVRTMDVENVLDRIKLCWSHLKDWEHLQIVQKSKEWLQKTNLLFAPTTFIAYIHDASVGMIEFIPQRLMEKVGLCPCRADPEKKKMRSRYVLGKKFDNCLFISCLWVEKDHQGKGVGKTILGHFLDSEVFKNSDGALVYVTERDERWDKHIHWPAGPKEFYLKAGFTIQKSLDKPAGYLLHYESLQP